jgi:hypothetical protein
VRHDLRPLVAFAPPAPMRTLTFLTTLIACVLLLALPASRAWANAADDRILTDCQESSNGVLRGSYPQQQLNHALHNIPSDQLEYSGCYDAIKQALIAGANGGGRGGDGANGGGGGGGTGGGGATASGFGTTGGTGSGSAGAGAPLADTPPPPGADRPVDVAGATIAPGALPEIGKDSHRLPTALLVLLVLLGVAALAPAALTIRRRVVDHRRA